MGSIGRYIFRTTFGAFLIVLVSLTGAIWMTQALRDVDLMTSQGQTVLVFIGITSLVIPHLVLVIAPVALVVAVAHNLHKLTTDSEIIVMNGAGMRPWALLQPFVAVTIVASVLLTTISAYVAPESLRMLRRWLTEVRTDLVSNIVQPGRFIAIESGLAFNIRERRPNGLLVGLLIDDRRDPTQRVTILAERGEILKNDKGNFLILESGSIQRHEVKQRDPNIVVFDRYAFDLSQVTSGPQTIKYSVRERYLWQLWKPDPDDSQYKEQPGQFRAELHDRLLAPVYPLAFVLTAFAFLGAPRTTRQSAVWSVTAVILAVSGLRLIGFASTVFTLKYPAAVLLQYVAVGGTIVASLYAISRGLIIEPPAFLTNAAARVNDWMTRRMGRDRGDDAMTGTLARYFGMRFLMTLIAVLLGIFALVILLDYVEMMRRLSDAPNVSALAVAKTSLFRVPQITERILPFCVLIGAMSCYLGLSRRLELVVSRAAGMSAWQFIAPAIFVALGVGVIATTIYNPIAATLQEKSKRLEAELSGNKQAGLQATVNGFWITQRSERSQSILNAPTSRDQGAVLGNVTAFVFDHNNKFLERVDATTATLKPGHWRLDEARIYAPGQPPREREQYLLDTNLTPEQVRETFSTPETVPFWQLPYFIGMAERAGLTATGYRLQYQKLLARPFMLAAMVMLAAAFSLRFVRFGGVQKMVLGGVACGFLLYVMSKLSDDLSTAELIPPVVAAWMPAAIGAMTGFVVLLYQEDG